MIAENNTRFTKHEKHEIKIVLRTFKNGSQHYELMCADCDTHIQYVNTAEASKIFEVLDRDK
mgnify:FL=1